MANWLGNARVENAGGLLGASRRWYLRTTNTETSGDVTPWEQTAGTQFTLYYRTSTTGLGPPDQADTIILEVRRSNGTVLKQLHNGAPPAQGTAFTVDLTDTGNAGGVDRSGGLELYVRAIRSGGLAPYDMNSTAVGDRGIINSNPKVSNIAVSAYPAGSTFAYGGPANEVITLTATHTEPYVATEGQIRIDALDVTAVQAGGSNQAYNGTTTVQTFIANNTFDDAAKSYGALLTPVGNSFLTPTSGAILWANFVDDGANVEQNGDNVRRQSFYTVDPRVTLGAPTLGKTLYNWGEAATIDVGVTNARGEALTRSLPFKLRDSLGALITTINDSGANYDVNYTPTSADKAANDATGDQWAMTCEPADTYATSAQNIYRVSSLRLLDLHTQITGTLNKDDFPNEDALEQYAAVILGNVVYTWVHVENIRNDGTEVDTSGSSLHLEIKDPDGGIQATYDFDTGADGWSSRINVNPTAPAGIWAYELSLTDQFGNTAYADHAITYVTPLTSNLSVISMSPNILLAGQDWEFRIRAEEDNGITEPQAQPTWRLFDEALSVVGSGNLRNIVDDQETLDGGLYRVLLSDMGALSAGRYTLQFEAKLNGNDIKEKETFYLVQEITDGSGFMGYPTKLLIQGSN